MTDEEYRKHIEELKMSEQYRKHTEDLEKRLDNRGYPIEKIREEEEKTKNIEEIKNSLEHRKYLEGFMDYNSKKEPENYLGEKKKEVNPLVYIAGPLTAATDEIRLLNISKGINLSARLWDDSIPNYAPHYIARAEFVIPSLFNKSEFWWRDFHSISILQHCTHLFLMEGWENSIGCRREEEYAKNNDKRRFYILYDLYKHFGLALTSSFDSSLGVDVDPLTSQDSKTDDT